MMSIDMGVRPIAVVIIPTIGLVIWMSRWFGKHGEWMKAMDEFKRDTKAALVEIRDDIKKVLAALPPNVLGGASPVGLTDLGKKVSECVEAAAWAEQKAPELIDAVTGKSAYDVQEFCIQYMRTEYKSATAQDESFKKCAFEHGIKLDQVLDVCAIELRDRLLRLLDSEEAEP